MEIQPITVTRPNEIQEHMYKDEGIVWTKEDNEENLVYKFTLLERSWVVLDVTTTDYIAGTWVTGNTYIAPKDFKWYRNSSLTMRILESGFCRYTESTVRFFMYLDAGTYYIKDDWKYDEVAYAFVIPNSAIISHNLKKSKDGKIYTDKVEYVPNIGTTYLLNTVISTDDYKNESVWKEASTDAEDVYTITENGEYTVKAVFNDAEWKDFPVMYSFSVYDIGKATKEDKSKDDDAKDAEVKLNYTSKTIKVGEKFKLKVTGANVVSFKSSKKSVAKVTSSGKVVGKKAGTATIKVKCDNGETYTCKVKVTK